ncbi:two-component system, chemotaxis family, sensor kinase CheA/two-component system, chemotaxis family, sensor histidine kinase and response regulator WspE [Desulfocicer vacuolatum DSM 3385]|uniref:histidine kinase n=1 Tax=Desulfocicer vacuolatum DSM 3385 TaxID=1121400 RepID=A0A1W2AK86_9BACT|nr:hybrid sensor histidine kinase/response regulator [Desulfocicer vacuolatum]SMC61086.1 two-component system, chemotaxis family, sensor kinase CheA/two-component system, chemotaxis family, sensor histidine kinase and response regulator WspE [Desulfocicer vacuolatum DSM 3385]
MAFDRSKFIPRFIEDANDHLRAMNRGLVSLVENPSDSSLVDAVFRAAHTIKGSSRMMKLIHISEMAHVLEDVLDGLRKKNIAYSHTVSTVLFDGMDTLSKMMTSLSQGEETEPPKKIMALLKQAAQGELEDQVDQEDQENCPDPKIDSEIEDSLSPDTGAVVRTDTDVQKDDGNVSRDSLKKNEISGTAMGAVEETIRVDVNKLDALINLMGEVVSTHKKAETHARQLHDLFLTVDDFKPFFEKKEQIHDEENSHAFEKFFHSLHDRLKQLDRKMQGYLGQFHPLMGQMQERSLELRMVPLSTVFDTLHMVVRDLCRHSEKTVSLEVSGGDTEMDKKMTEHLKDPLLHMVRNCIDHGVEPEAVRLKAGKPPHGTISIGAGIEGGRVCISVADDGGGILVDKVAEKALSRGIVTESSLKEMKPLQVAQLIFNPGLSTAEIITDISGRGVGMDVVRQNIENILNGTITVETTPGRGTVFHIRLPETIAIIHVFIVTLNSVCYAIPASHVTEIVSIPANEIFKAQEKDVLRLRGELVPVVSMGEVLGHAPFSHGVDIRKETSVLILISGQKEDRLGMIIDSLLSEEEQVVKPLPLHMRGLHLVTGAILSDSHGIILVLHMLHMVEQAKKIHSPVTASSEKEHDPERFPPHILVVDDAVTTREIEKSILESHGYKVTVAIDGVDGFKKAGEFAYDLIVSDVDMPRLDGFAMTEKIRAIDMHAHTPIVIVTARDSQSDMKKGISSGANAYIVKGDFDKNNLLETIENLLGL